MSQGHYQVTSYPIYETDEGLRERQDTAVFLVLDESPRQDEIGVIDGLRWAKRDFCQMGGFNKYLRVGAIKIWRYDIAPLLEDGRCCSGPRCCIFEWKCDWPNAQGRTSDESRKLLAEIVKLGRDDWFFKDEPIDS